jgi:hypothetical protein
MESDILILTADDIDIGIITEYFSDNNLRGQAARDFLKSIGLVMPCLDTVEFNIIDEKKLFLAKIKYGI